MQISIDDHINEPDVFILKALNSKVEWLNLRINELIATGKNKAELERLVSARADFMEVLRSPRLYLAKPLGAATPASGPRPAGGGIPFGAIPQPRKLGAAVPEPGDHSTPMASHTPSHSHQPAQTSPTAPMPASSASAAPSAKPGGMLSFLKGVQTQSPAGGPTTAASAPSPSPAASAAPAVSSSPTPPARGPMPAPAAAPADTRNSRPDAGTESSDPPSKGQMLSFLEKVKTGSPAPTAAATTGPARSKELSYESKKALIEMLKARASTTGFQDIYEMLNFKKEKLIEHRAVLLKTSNLPASQVTLLIDKEIAEIDGLLMKRPQEILPQVQEFDEVAKVDTGGLAAIRLELKGLLDEIK